MCETPLTALDLFLPELLVARPDPEPRPDEGDERLVLAEGEGGPQQEALGVAKLGVELHVGVRVVVRPGEEVSNDGSNLGVSESGPWQNKNRLCSRTCGIDKITKFKKIAKKN